MKRIAILLLLPLIAAAGPSHGKWGRDPMLLTIMAKPQFAPATSAQSPARFEPAPVPNLEAAAPTHVAQQQSELVPTLFPSKPQYRGDGFISHSTSQDEQEKNYHPIGGLALKMPLE